MNIAIFSPNENAYSETFIKAHKNYLKSNVFFYYGQGLNKKLEGDSALVDRRQRWVLAISKRIFRQSNEHFKIEILKKSFQKNKIDAVLVEYGTHAYYTRNFLKELEIPVLVYYHGYDASVGSVIEECEYYKDVFEIASHIFVVSKVMKNNLLSINCPVEKIVYNPYGAQPEFHKVQPLFSKKQFVGIGRFTDKKAPYYVILAFAEVLKKHPDAQLVIAGNGELFNVCKNLVNHLRIGNNISLPGIIKPNDFQELLTESIAFVQHSITADNGDQEGMPLAVLESASAGLPVISTIHAGIPEAVEHNKTGLLCEEHDVESMATNMIKLLDNPDLAKEMGSLAKIKIQQELSFERHIKGIQDTLELAVKEYRK